MSEQDDMDLANNQSVDDLITLGELTQYENTVWKFPQTTRCPLRSCGIYLGTRKKAIKHYQDNHAKYGVLCKICDYPIHLQTATHHFDGHYARKHPNEVAPPKMKAARFNCSLCQATMKTHVYLQMHMKNVHKKNAKKSQNKKKNENLKVQRKNANGTTRRRNTAPNVSENGVTHSDISASTDDSNECDESSDTVDESTKPEAKAKQSKQLTDRKPQRLMQPNDVRPCTICRISLKNYVIACNHYRQVHGRNCSMCPFCKTYFARSTALIQHMMVYHEMTKPLKVSSIQSKKSTTKNTRKKTKSNQSQKEGAALDGDLVTSVDANWKPDTEISDLVSTTNESNSNGMTIEPTKTPVDDIITLGEMTEYPTIQWTFPQITQCPKANCKHKCLNRDDAIDHYRMAHAKYDMLCHECDQIISLSGAHNLMNHYKRRHPGVELPVKTSENRSACQVCGKMLSFPQLRIHMENKHKHAKINSASVQTITIKRSSRVLMRKVSVHTQPATQLKASSSSMKIVLKRYASVPNVNGENSSTQPPMSVELTNKNDEHRNNPNGSSNRSLGKALQYTSEHQLDVDQRSDETPSLTETSAYDTSLKPAAKQNTRSTGVRHKACTLCGMSLKNYALAWDHYQRIHGRNVLICPFCDQYFLQSNLLTKHVMTMHKKFNFNTESASSHVQSKNSIDNAQKASVSVVHSVVSQLEESDFIYAETSTSMESNNQQDQTALPNDEPLDLSLKRDDVSPFSIDLASGALDLSLKLKTSNEENIQTI